MQHYTRNTVEASEWCRKCGKSTRHRIDGVKLGPCLVCLGSLNAAHAERVNTEKPATQLHMFAPAAGAAKGEA